MREDGKKRKGKRGGSGEGVGENDNAYIMHTYTQRRITMQHATIAENDNGKNRQWKDMTA